jgi:hypothetical protein
LSVVPSNSVAVSANSVTIGTIPAARAGSTMYVPFKVYLPTVATPGTDTVVLNAEVVSAPVATTNNAASAFNASGTAAANDSGGLIYITRTNGGSLLGDAGRAHASDRTLGLENGAGSYTGVAAATSGAVVVTTAENTLGYVEGYVKVTPDVAGSYTIMVSANKSRSGASTLGTATELQLAGDASTTFTFVAGATAPTSITLTTLGGGTIHAGSPNGTLVEVKTNAPLAGQEGVVLSVSGATGSQVATGTSTPGSFSTSISLAATAFSTGSALVWVRTTGTTAGTLSLTATGDGALPASVTTTKSFTVNVATGSATAMTYQSPSATATYASADATEAASSNKLVYGLTSTAQALGFTFTAYGATRYGYVTITDTEGLLSGVAAAVYDVAYSVGSTAEGLTLSYAANAAVPGAAKDPLFTVAIPAAATTTLGVASAVTKTFASVARGTANGSFTFTPASSIIAAPGAAIAITATVKDEYGAAWANKSVVIATSGRNNPASTTLVTDASGKITFTTADTSTSTTALVDTISFTTANVTTGTVTINYANTAVGTVTVTGGNTTASVTSLTATENPISLGSSTAGTEAGAIAITATVKDASGNLLVGVPVSFSVAGEGVAITTTTATVYTGANGTAAASLYAWKSGTYTYTATAGGKSTTGTATFASTTATNARVVSASVSGSVVTGKVVDRFGNSVKNVTLYATTSGGANIGGSFSVNGATDGNGEIKWVVTGSGSVTVSAVNPTSVAGTTYGETCALAGNRTCATASTAAAAYSATVAGTTTTAEKFVGSTFSPAGVASASVTVTAVDAAADAANAASDAAAEAIDAANAATDAANLAAEAADAATVAAEEARDAADAATAAVEELATQVATLMAALKAQITTLANTVAKIAKKVKA